VSILQFALLLLTALVQPDTKNPFLGPDTAYILLQQLLLLLLLLFNGLFSRTTWVSWHQKGKPFLILMKQEMKGW